MRMSILAIASLSAVATSHAATIREDITHKTVPLSLNASISIQNEDGGIWIYGANIQEAQIQVIKRAYSQEQLNAIQVDLVATADQLSIDTKYPPRPRWSLRDRSGTVDYVLVVPWTCRIARAQLANGEALIDGMRESAVHAELRNGRLFVHNCFGEIHAEVASGGLGIAYDWWEKGKLAVTARILSGNMRAVFPDNAAFHLLATSVNGDVVSDFVGEQDRQRGGTPKIDIVTRGEPKAEIALEAVNGSIQVAEIRY